VLALLTCLLAPPGSALASEAEASDEQSFDGLPAPLKTLTPESAIASDQAEFSGNPTSSMFGWWPEDLVLAPIPGRTPEFGWSLAVVGGYFVDLDRANEDTPSSIIGAFGWFTENKSYAGGVGAKLNLLSDRLRINLAAGYADVNYRFYGIGNDAGEEGLSVQIDQQVPVYYATVKYELLPRTYFGLGYLASKVDTRIRFDLLPPGWEIPKLGKEVNLAAVGIPIEFDTRDHEQFPRNGWHIDARGMLYRGWAGSDVDTEALSVSMNRYLPMRKRDVLAMRITTRATGDDAPFYLLSTFGGRTDLRGYESGRYRDRMMYAAQAEYRWQPHDRWVFTGFAGVGEVAPSYGDFFENLLPAAGLGTRFVLSAKHKLNLALDVAVGKHGAEFYFGVGEVF
jgi:outer membrane protein assembly factor BamA